MIPYLQTILAGLLATAAMTVLLYTIHFRGISEADMIRAIGSLVTRREEGALVPGLCFHLVTGILFSFIYVGFWSMFPVDSVGVYVGLGLITGFAHGLVVSFLLVILVAEHHPMQRFQEAGMGVAIVHLAAHVLYGLIVGLVAGSFMLRFDFIQILGQ